MNDDQAAVLDRTTDFGGTYAFCHDGWQGVLVLDLGSGQERDGHYDCVRTGRRFEAHAVMDSSPAGPIQLTIYRFNQAPRQVFDGYRFGPRGEAFAGTTMWRKIPFGFFARKSGFRWFSRYGSWSDRVAKEDVLGTYTVWHPSGIGTFKIVPQPRGIVGQYFDTEGKSWPGCVKLGRGHYHQIGLSFPIGGQLIDCIGYLFTRQKNGIAGTATYGGRKTGFYMLKFDEHYQGAP